MSPEDLQGQLRRAAAVKRDLRDQIAKLEKDLADAAAERRGRMPLKRELAKADAENTRLESAAINLRLERDRLDAELAESRKLGLQENTELGEARRRLYALEDENTRLYDALWKATVRLGYCLTCSAGNQGGYTAGTNHHEDCADRDGICAAERRAAAAAKRKPASDKIANRHEGPTDG